MWPAPDQEELSMMNGQLAAAFRRFATEKLAQNMTQIERCAALLRPAQVWHRDNDHTNSVGNLILHLDGNIRQWIVAGLGGAVFERDRPAEFAARGPLPVDPIVTKLRATTDAARAVIADLQPADLARTFEIQGYAVTGLVAVAHVVEHASFHTGQIVHVTKALRNVDLSLYDDQGRKHADLGTLP
jgi:uncharacterized damage-inducible protein DinB